MIDEQMIGEQMIQETNDSGPDQKGTPPPPSCLRPLPDPVLCEAEELTRYRLLATGYRLPASTAPSLPAFLVPVPCSLVPVFTPPPYPSAPHPPIVF